MKNTNRILRNARETNTSTVQATSKRSGSPSPGRTNNVTSSPLRSAPQSPKNATPFPYNDEKIGTNNGIDGTTRGIGKETNSRATNGYLRRQLEALKREYYNSYIKDPNVLVQIQELERELGAP